MILGIHRVRLVIAGGEPRDYIGRARRHHHWSLMLARVRRCLVIRLAACRRRLGQSEGVSDTTQHGDDGDRAAWALEHELATADRSRLIDEADRLVRTVKRIDRGEYGACTDCGAPITRARLTVMPEAERCLACQDTRERALRGDYDRVPAPPEVEEEET